MTRPIRVHSLEEARVALSVAAELGCGVVLVSAPGAAAHGGAGWFSALVAAARRDVPGVPVRAILDCDDLSGLVLAALRIAGEAGAGVEPAYSGPESVAARLAEIAGASGNTLHPKVADSLDLSGVQDMQSACRRWLSRGP